MRRRDFVGLLSGAVGWPPAALAQQHRPTYLETAEVLGLDVPRSIRPRANEVIE